MLSRLPPSLASHATREPAIATWKTPAPPTSSTTAVFLPLTVIVLPVLTFQTSTLFTAFFCLAPLAVRSKATLSPSTASAATG